MNKQQELERLNRMLARMQTWDSMSVDAISSETRLVNTILRLEEAIALDKRMEYLANAIAQPGDTKGANPGP